MVCLLSWVADAKAAKEMRKAVLRLAIGVLVAGLAVVAGYEHLRSQRLAALNAESMATIASALGRVVSVLVAAPDAAKSLGSQQAAVELKAAIAPLTLTLIAGDLDVAALNADSFAGLCTLIANADRLFPIDERDSVDQQVNALLNARLHALQAAVRNESTARSLRPGDRHKCALQGAAG